MASEQPASAPRSPCHRRGAPGIVTAIVVWLLLLTSGGAIVNVAVAWGVSNAWGEKRQITRTYSDGTVEHVSFPMDLQQGWPLPALLSEVPTPEGGATIWTIELTNRIELALWPLWPGFAINTFFYAGILWLLFATPGRVRRWRRMKRGLCPVCAYPVGASDTCTECGGRTHSPSVRGTG